MPSFDFLEKGREIVSASHFVYEAYAAFLKMIKLKSFTEKLAAAKLLEYGIQCA